MVVAGVLSGVLGAIRLGDGFAETLATYPSDASAISLHSLPAETAATAVAQLVETAQHSGAAVVRKDPLIDRGTGEPAGYRIGFAGDTAAQADALSLSYLGTPVLTPANLADLAESEPGKTLGLDLSRADLITELPGFQSVARIVGVKLDDLISQSQTAEGTYQLIGLDTDAHTALVTELAALTGQDAERLTGNLSGSSTSAGLLPGILFACLLATLALLALVLVLAAFQGFRTLGTHLLLGWSRVAFVRRNLAIVAVAAVACLPLSLVALALVSSGFAVTPEFALAAAAGWLPVAGGTLVACGLAAAVVLSVQPIRAIRNRVSRKGLLVTVGAAYVIANGGLVAGAHALDQPLRGVAENVRIQQTWHDVETDLVLAGLTAGDDAASLSGQSTRLEEDLLAWYRSIEHRPGVRLIHTEHFDAELLDTWRAEGTYQHVPHHPLWYFAMSPTALQEAGVALDDDVRELSARGTRVVLLPDTLSAADRAQIAAWERENSQSFPAESGNAFAQNPGFEFRTYSPGPELFTWTTAPGKPLTVTDPVIYVADTNSMTPFEAQSLNAAGLDNGYLKLTAEAAQAYATEASFAAHGLADNQPRFVAVKELIAGLQQQLTAFIQSVAVTVAVIAAVVLLLVLSLLQIYRTIHREAIAVQRLLGFPLARIFAPVFGVVLLVGLGALLAAALLGTPIGPPVLAALLAAQLALALGYAKRLSEQSRKGST